MWCSLAARRRASSAPGAGRRLSPFPSAVETPQPAIGWSAGAGTGPFHRGRIVERPPVSAGSLAPNVGRLNDRPPFLDFGFLKSAECLWSLLVERRSVHAEIGQPSAHGRLGHGLPDSSIE